MSLHLPIDFERLVEVRRLKKHYAKNQAIAVTLFVRLYVELGYLAGSGHTLGRVTKSELELFDEDLNKTQADFGTASAQLIASGLLAPDPADPNRFICDRFAADNPHLAPGATNIHERGWLTSKVARAERRAKDESLQLALMIPEKFFQIGGKPMAPDTCNRILVLIRSLDSVLLAPNRPDHAFTETLIHDAYQVISRHDEPAIRQTLQRLIRFRKHPRMQGATTELFLADWDHTAAKIGT